MGLFGDDTPTSAPAGTATGNSEALTPTKSISSSNIKAIATATANTASGAPGAPPAAGTGTAGASSGPGCGDSVYCQKLLNQVTTKPIAIGVSLGVFILILVIALYFAMKSRRRYKNLNDGLKSNGTRA